MFSWLKEYVFVVSGAGVLVWSSWYAETIMGSLIALWLIGMILYYDRKLIKKLLVRVLYSFTFSKRG